MKISSFMQKIFSAVLIFAVLLSAPYHSVSAEAIVWNEVEVEETTKKPPAAKKAPQKGAEKLEEITSFSETDQLIAEFRRKQKEDDKFFERLMKQKEQEAQKEKARKEELAKIVALQEKQKQETDKKLTAALLELEELKRQNTEQQAKQNQSIYDLMLELKNKQTEQEKLIQELETQREQSVQQAQAAQNIAISKIVETSYTPSNTIFTNKATQNQGKTIHDHINANTQDGSKAFSSEADIIFNYSAGALYRVYCSEGFLTDIQFEPGENIEYIGGGDTARWIIDRAQSGSGAERKWHIYLKPIRSDQKTNFVVTTDRRSYQICAESGDWYNPIVRFAYPEQLRKAVFAQEQLLNNSVNFSVMSVDNLNFGYKISKKSYAWSPKTVFDDGVKTYIKVSEQMSANEAPVLFIKDSNGQLAMVNYRVKNDCYIVDRLFKEAEMRNGKEVVTIKRAS